MVQQVRALAAKPHNLSSISGTHTMERINSHKLSSALYVHAMANMDPHKYTHNKVMNF